MRPIETLRATLPLETQKPPDLQKKEEKKGLCLKKSFFFLFLILVGEGES